MRTFLMSIFWITTLGGVIQLLVIAFASWIVVSSSYSFLELDANTLITEFVPWFIWLKTLIITVFGELGRLILGIPILVIAPLQLVAGTMIGFWAYFTAKKMPMLSAHV